MSKDNNIVYLQEDHLARLADSLEDNAFWEDLLTRYPDKYPDRIPVIPWTARERLCVFLAEAFIRLGNKLLPTLMWAIEMEISFQRCEGGDTE